MRNRFLTRWAIAVVLLLGLAGYIVSPYIAFFQIRSAARTGDRNEIAEMVDFPAVRDSLKSQVSAGIMGKAGTDANGPGNPLASIGAMLLPAFTDRAIDLLITPDMIAMLIQQGRIKLPPAGHDSQNDGAADHQRKTDFRYGYRSPDRFQVNVARRDDPDRQLGLTFERRGLFTWKLAQVELPDGIFH